MAAAESFSEFAELCEKLTRTPGKNLKVQLISEYLQKLGDDRSLEAAVLFFSGSVFPKGSGLALNVGFKIIMESLSSVARLEPDEIQKTYLQYGDLGSLAEYAIARKLQTSLVHKHLLLAELHEQLKKLAGITGSGAAGTKARILAGLLINCSPLEAKFLVKIAAGEMRTGVVEGIIEVAVAAAFGRELEQMRKALLLIGDLSQVAVLAKKDLLAGTIMKPLVPFSFMLADVMFSAEEIASYYGGKQLVCESKYDGVRVQLHKSGQQVKLFSRRLDDITASFPEIADAARARLQPNEVILDGELMAYRDGRPLHFQELQKRLRRKHVTTELTKETPVVYVPYDVLFLKSPVLDLPLSERKKLLSDLRLLEPPLLDLGYSMVSTAEQIAEAFDKSRKSGHEGLVLKEPESLYHPGKRGRHWAKLKTELDTVDAVIVAAEYGHGKRAGSLSDYTFAVRDGSSFRTIGKAYSGLTDKEIAEMTRRLRSMIVKDEGYRLEVRPEIVLEIAFDSIQKSDRHDSGFALRFPRIKYVRHDKPVGDIDTLEKVRKIYENQAHVKSG